MKHDRILALDGPLNFRDIGGYQNDKGQHVKWNKIYRSDSLSSLSDEDQEKLVERRITVDVDLRSKYEQNSAPDKLWPNVRFIDAHIYSENRKQNKGDNKLYRFVHHIPDMGDNWLGQIYQQVLLNSHSQHEFAKIFAELIELPEEDALVYHCSAGKDRTGMTSALICPCSSRLELSTTSHSSMLMCQSQSTSASLLASRFSRTAMPMWNLTMASILEPSGISDRTSGLLGKSSLRTAFFVL